MLMTDFEIVRDFKNAAKKGKQIGILADMNGCSREKIREVLVRNGISEAELPGKPGRRVAEEEKEIFRPAKSAKQKPGGGSPVVVGGTKLPAQESVGESKMDNPYTATTEPEASHAVVPEVPEAVKKACRDRIWGIVQEIAELEREKRELQVFLGENA